MEPTSKLFKKAFVWMNWKKSHEMAQIASAQSIFFTPESWISPKEIDTEIF